jgi:hypothetical protein
MLSEVKRNGVLEYYLIANKWHGTYEEFGSSAPDTPEQASKQASKQKTTGMRNSNASMETVMCIP